MLSATEEARAHLHGSFFRVLQSSPHALLREMTSGPWSPNFVGLHAAGSIAAGVATRAVSSVKTSSSRSLPFGRARAEFSALFRRCVAFAVGWLAYWHSHV